MGFYDRPGSYPSTGPSHRSTSCTVIPFLFA
jgi:hypothetical protein